MFNSRQVTNKTQFTKVFSAAVVVFAAWNPLPAAASGCTASLGAINHWFLTQPNGPGTYEVTSLFAGNDGSGNYVAYGEGSSASPIALTYHAAVPPRGPKLPGYPAYISESSPVVEYFSDRRYSAPGSLSGYPFDPSAVDSLGVQIILQDWQALGIAAGQTTFTLYTWGGSKYTMAGTCQNGLLYGFIGNTLETLSLTEFYSQIPHDRTRGRASAPVSHKGNAASR